MSKSENGARRELARFDRLSAEELRRILRQDSLLDESDDTDPETILCIAKLLAARGQDPVDVDAAWEEFERDYRPCIADADPLFSFDEAAAPHAQKRGRLLPRLAAVAAVIALILTMGTVTAYARRYDLMGAVAKWSHLNFRFADVQETKPPFYNLSAALSTTDIKEPVVPKWLPEGYGDDELSIYETPLYEGYHSYCYLGEDTISISVTHYSSDERGNRVYETDPRVPPVIYESGGVEHYLMMNGGYRRALWRVGDLECSILGKVTEADMKHIVDSIYE